jgi:CubicO group peptidase (beta-lactamase class C family)
VTRANLHLIDGGLPKGVQGAADPHFACAIRLFSNLFPGRRFGCGALSVYLDGRPVVDVWTGWSDRRGEVPWSADTGAMVFSATKGVAATVIHRLVDRGLLNYDAPVADFWPEFGANGKSAITVRDLMRHRAGLSHLNGVNKTDLLDHRLMERMMAAAPLTRLRGHPAYHALTYGWLISGLARAVTGLGMRELIRVEVARPLDTDGLHLGRPPADAPTQAAQILAPQRSRANTLFNFVAPKYAALWFSGAFGSMYFPGAKSYVQGDIPFLDSEIPSVNGVFTARALAKMYGAIANGGCIDGTRFLSAELVRGLTGKPSLRADLNIVAACLAPWLPFRPGPRRAARVRSRRTRRLDRLGRPRLRDVDRFRAQPIAHPDGVRSGGVRWTWQPAAPQRRGSAQARTAGGAAFRGTVSGAAGRGCRLGPTAAALVNGEGQPRRAASGARL